MYMKLLIYDFHKQRVHYVSKNCIFVSVRILISFGRQSGWNCMLYIHFWCHLTHVIVLLCQEWENTGIFLAIYAPPCLHLVT